MVQKKDIIDTIIYDIYVEKISLDTLRYHVRVVYKGYGEKGIYKVFSTIHDNIYHDIVTKKIYIPLPIRRTIETLALPLFRYNDLDKNKIYKKMGFSNFL